MLPLWSVEPSLFWLLFFGLGTKLVTAFSLQIQLNPAQPVSSSFSGGNNDGICSVSLSNHHAGAVNCRLGILEANYVNPTPAIAGD